MFRTSALLLLAASVAVAVAADPPKTAPAEPEKSSQSLFIELTTVTVKDGAITRDVTEYVPQTVDVQVEEMVNGKKVTVTKKETRTVPVTKRVQLKLKDLKVTGTDGKAIAAADVEKKLKDGGAVVMHFGKLGDDFRKLFKDGTVFIEEVPPEPPAPEKKEDKSK